MKPLARWMLWLYPRVWRKRYRAELEALIEDSGCGWQVVFDLLKEALKMRVLESWSFAQLAMALGLAGVLAAAVSAPRPTWISQAELKMTSSAATQEEIIALLVGVQNATLSR